MISIRIGIVFILFLLSSFFSGSETAIFSLSKHNVEVLKYRNKGKAFYLSRILNSPDKLLISILIGNMIVNIFATSISTKIFTDFFVNSGPAISFIAVTLIIIIFGEIVPKVYAINNAREFTIFSIGNIFNLSKILFPFIEIFNFFIKIVKGICRKFIKKVNRESITTEQLKGLLRKESEGIEINGYEKKLLENLFEFPEIFVDEIMVPRNEIFAIPVNLTYTELLQNLRGCEFSIIPVYDLSQEDIKGEFNIKSLLEFENDSAFDFNKILEQPVFVPERMYIYSLFEKMRKEKLNMVFVVDEYGGLSGLITLEDIIEEIVGEIYNKGKEEVKVERLSDKSFVTYGRLELRKMTDYFSGFPESESVETLGGYIAEKLGRFPKINEEVRIKGLLFKVCEVKRGKIGKILIEKFRP